MGLQDRASTHGVSWSRGRSGGRRRAVSTRPRLTAHQLGSWWLRGWFSGFLASLEQICP
ncbi:hypothetical protein C2845_PM01G47430 [Panicum miliaceum]|uniref:Uncharacterized protein n=1 Tax=Panicum miliaceum TaxID=4540 RepID=A0A3L6TSV6_PANMI|nr:hypothetical protein C2845_PM01G47430 [Panicum miliaceum]